MSIKEQFIKVIQATQGIPEPKVDSLFTKWERNKRFFYTKFGNRYIYEYPEEVVFELSDSAKQSKLEEFIEIVSTNYNNSALANFLEMNTKNFFSNLTVEPYHDSYYDIYVPKGTKIIRAFKYFEDNKKVLSELQSLASQIVQENKVRGTLCLSIHPLDYLSVSETPYGWTSCHSLDGDYRLGNLNYMVDKSTVVCYLKSTNDTFDLVPGVEWNCKKWRMLMFFSTDFNMVFAGRQYPFFHEPAMDFVLKKIFVEVFKDYWSDWYNEYIDHLSITKGNDKTDYLFNSRYVPVGPELVKMEELTRRTSETYFFNDLLWSNYYTKPYYAFREYCTMWRQTSVDGSEYLLEQGGRANVNTTIFDLGEPVPCLRCGKTATMISSRMQCCDCEAEYGTEDLEEFAYCACCNRRFFEEDGIHIDDCLICPSCAENETTCCEHCGNLEFNYNMRYNRKLDMWLCVWCDDDFKNKE